MGDGPSQRLVMREASGFWIASPGPPRRGSLSAGVRMTVSSSVADGARVGVSVEGILIRVWG